MPSDDFGNFEYLEKEPGLERLDTFIKNEIDEPAGPFKDENPEDDFEDAVDGTDEMKEQ